MNHGQVYLGRYGYINTQIVIVQAGVTVVTDWDTAFNFLKDDVNWDAPDDRMITKREPLRFDVMKLNLAHAATGTTQARSANGANHDNAMVGHKLKCLRE